MIVCTGVNMLNAQNVKGSDKMLQRCRGGDYLPMCSGSTDLINISVILLFPYQMLPERRKAAFKLQLQVSKVRFFLPPCDSDYLFSEVQKAALGPGSAVLIRATRTHGSKSDPETSAGTSEVKKTIWRQNPQNAI